MFTFEGQKGNAFVIILWLVAILGILVSAFALIAISQYEVVESLKHVGTTTLMVESGLDSWLGLVRLDTKADTEAGVIVTEVLNYAPIEIADIPDYPENMLSNWYFDDWTGGEQPTGWSGSHSFSTNWHQDADALVGSHSAHVDGGGGERTLSQLGKSMNDTTKYYAQVWVKGTGDVKLGIKYPGSSYTHYSSFTSVSSSDWVKVDHERTPSNNGTDGGLKIVTDNESGDGLRIGATWLGDTLPPTSWPPETPPLVDHEYIEVYNSGMAGGSPPDLAAGAYGIEDTLDADGVAVSNAYDIRIHPADPNHTDGVLDEFQVGVILPVDADTSQLGLEAPVNSGAVRLYTPWDSGTDTYSFLTGGLHDTDMEHIVFSRPGGWSNDEVLSGGATWTPATVEKDYSRQKIALTEENQASNWQVSSAKYGTPGEVGASGAGWNAHYLADWAWGGEIVPGVAVGDTVYLPSLDGTFDPDVDFGYYRITAIQDESGKQDLEAPHSTDALGESLTSGRTMRLYNWAQDIVDSTDPWITTMDLHRISYIGEERIKALLPSYSAYRLGNARQVNINTASWEALRGIRINDASGTGYLTDEMVKKIISRRSGVSLGTVEADLPIDSTTDPYYPELTASYVTTGADTYATIAEACSHLEPLSDAFNCEVFKEYAMVGSEGILRVKVEGGRLDSTGQVVARTVLHALVDRRPVATGEPIELIYKRIR